MSKENGESEDKIYTIKIVPDDGGTVHSFHLPLRLVQFGIASAVIGTFLFIGAFSYAAYSAFSSRNDSLEIGELRQVNSIQQEQLLQLSKKANTLQEQMEQLIQVENEIRRLSGATPMEEQEKKEDTPQEGEGKNLEQNGQGGPYVQPDVKNVSMVLDQLERDMAKHKESLFQLQEQIKEQQAKYGGGGIITPGFSVMTPSIWPAKGIVSSPYGLRWNGSDFHPGIDIANDMGTPILATADGVVSVAGWNSGGYGNMVDIEHGNGLMTRYGHACQVVVVAGQSVRRGQVIAYMGSTGFSTGPHVHYEVRINGQAINPISYLH